jgi:glycosyltransferase involved in cell wall biosynthesis
MTDTVALDLTRLCIGPAWRAPRGIDRVDLAYADHFLSRWRGDCVATLLTPWGAQYLDRARAVNLVQTVEGYWKETTSTHDDGGYREARAMIEGERLPPRADPSRKRDVRISAAVVNVFRSVGIPAGSPAAAKLPRNAVYINTGQLGIADIKLLSWIDQRPDLRPVFMLHDTIPLDFPEFVPPLSPGYHRQMIRNTARYAAGLIVTSQAAGQDIRRELIAEGNAEIPTVAAPIPPSPVFSDPATVISAPPDTPYFVICGSIEPRKNHMLLLNVWRELLRIHGPKTPKLVIVGSRWSRNSDALAFLQKCSILAPYVVQVSRMSTAALTNLLAGARALLMPSFAEGFGLPIVEALAAHTPVIASNIPAHVEAGAGHGTYLSPLDGLGWLRAIEDHVVNHEKYRAALASYRPYTWPEYFARIEAFISTLAAKSAPRADAAE